MLSRERRCFGRSESKHPYCTHPTGSHQGRLVLPATDHCPLPTSVAGCPGLWICESTQKMVAPLLRPFNLWAQEDISGASACPELGEGVGWNTACTTPSVASLC